MMVVPKTIPFAIELKSEDNGACRRRSFEAGIGDKRFINAIYKE